MEKMESEAKIDACRCGRLKREAGIEPASSSFLRNLVFRRGDQLKAQILRPLCEPFEKALLVLFFIALLTNIRVFMSKLAGLFQIMGIAKEMLKKTVVRNPGAGVADVVAKGQAEVGITFTSEMIVSKGV